jgi:hypothetical protein
MQTQATTQHRIGLSAKRAQQRPIALVVLEAGAAWPTFLTRERLASDCDVLIQQPDESFALLTRRVLARVQRLSLEGRSIALGVIATGKDGSEQAMESRCRIARALVVARTTQSAELVLIAGEASPRHELSALAATLRAGLSGSDFVVRVRSL